MRENFTLLRGSVRLRVQGRRPERVLNLLTVSGIRFWGLKKLETDTLTFQVANDKARRAEKICDDAGLSHARTGKKGLPTFLGKVKKRYILLIFPVLCVLTVLYLSLLVWDIEVTGNETVTRGAIIDALEKSGLEIGTFTLTVDRELIRSRVIAEIPELSWVSIHINGSKTVVDVRERTPKPDIVDIYADMDVRASKSGLITKINILQGKPLVKVGDTVLAGEMLVSGTMDSTLGDTRYVHAQAEVYARTWYEFSASMPLRYITKRYTGEEHGKTALEIGNIRTNLYFSSGVSVENCDKIVSSKRLELPFGIVLPICIVSEQYREYEQVVKELDAAAAQAELEQALMERLRQLAPSAEINAVTYTPVTNNGILTVTLSAECVERIDTETLITPLQPEGDDQAS